MKMKNQEIINRMKIKPNDYSSAKKISEEIDDLIGFNYVTIEAELLKNHGIKKLSDSQQFWFGLDVQSLQTPYSEILHMIEVVRPQRQSIWCDLGAAYGRMGIALAFIVPEISFLGYEAVADRVLEAQRIYKLLKISSAQMAQANIADKNFVLPNADLFFIYDFGSKEDVSVVLEKIKSLAATKTVQVIARGRGIRNWILLEHPWLSQVQEPQHFEHWSLFKS